MKKACVLMLAVAIPAMVGCSGADSTDSQTDDSTATQYVPFGEFKDSMYQDAAYDLRNKLNGEFYDVCGDTFCEGDFSNIVGLSLNCAVSSIRGDIHDCAWTFTGSTQSVNPQTAAIEVDAVTYQCHFKPKTTVAKFVTLLTNSADALHEPLPGMGSIYDGLSDCFDHPIRTTPAPMPGGDGTEALKYVDPDTYYTSAASEEKWRKAQAGLKLGFDNICGDTFCGSDFGDLQSLDFTCAVTKSTGNVKGCAWVFGGSYSTVNATKGTVDEVSQTWTCPVATKGTIGKLISTLNAAPDAIRATLPGETTTAYDAIATDCLP